MEDLPFFRIGGENLSKNRVNAMIVLTLIVGLAVGYSLSIALPYQLPPKKPAISLSVNPVKAGDNYTATITGFPANTEIYGWTVNQNPPQMFSAGTTDATGKLVTTASAPQTPGTWPLIACDKSQSTWATTTLTVTTP